MAPEVISILAQLPDHSPVFRHFDRREVQVLVARVLQTLDSLQTCRLSRSFFLIGLDLYWRLEANRPGACDQLILELVKAGILPLEVAQFDDSTGTYIWRLA